MRSTPILQRPAFPSPRPALDDDRPLPAWTALLALLVIVASALALYGLSL